VALCITSPASSSASAYDWRTITALNAVSTLSQIGQFGIVYVMVPVWLALQGLSAAQLGFFAASLWMGQIPVRRHARVCCGGFVRRVCGCRRG
jgi:hypothetical protein